jgi:DMSO/TMAO reductase YedYZ molybdopterin-dependent catalytic subunit
MGFLTDIHCPVFNAERLIRVPERADYKITVGGSCKRKGVYGLSELLSFFRTVTINSRLTSVSRWSVRADWHGVPWADFIKWAEPASGYTHVYFESCGGYATTVERKHLENQRVIVATHVGGDELEFQYGGPIRMVIPNLWGYKSCKWLKSIYFIDEYIRGFWEGAGYPDEGLIEPCMVKDVNTGENRKINGGEVTEF